MSHTYRLTLTIKRKLSSDEQDELRGDMESEASSYLYDLFGGDSGDVRLAIEGDA